MKSKTMGWPEDWWEAMNAEATEAGVSLTEWIRICVAKQLSRKGHSNLTRVKKRGEFDHSDPGYKSKMSEKKSLKDWYWEWSE